MDRDVKWSCMESGKQSITSLHPLEMYVCLSVCYKPLDVITSCHPATEWLVCRTQAQKVSVQITVATLSGNSLSQTVHAHCAFIHQAEKLAAALLRVAGVTAGLAESNGSLLPGL